MTAGIGIGTQSYVGESGLSYAFSNPMALLVGTICGVRLPPTGSFRCQIPVSFGVAGEAALDWAVRRVEACSATTTNSAKATAPIAVALRLDLMDLCFAVADAPEPYSPKGLPVSIVGDDLAVPDV